MQQHYLHGVHLGRGRAGERSCTSPGEPGPEPAEETPGYGGVCGQFMVLYGFILVIMVN